MPKFREMVLFFEEAYEQAPERAMHVFPKLQGADKLGTLFVRNIAKAGGKPWPLPRQNLRASRATELADL